MYICIHVNLLAFTKVVDCGKPKTHYGQKRANPKHTMGKKGQTQDTLSNPRHTMVSKTTPVSTKPTLSNGNTHNTLLHTATHCNTLQRTATHCNTLEDTATREAQIRT